MQKLKPDYYNNLDKVYSKIWNLLKLGLKNRDAPFHIPVFICGSSNKFDGRIVVLRGVDESEKIQLRINGQAKINYQNTKTKKSWKQTVHMSRQCYLGNKAPGSYIPLPASGLTNEIDNLKYTLEESEIGYKNFCVIETYIKSIEWLYLAAKGHRRAYFSLKNNSLEKKWLIP